MHMCNVENEMRILSQSWAEVVIERFSISVAQFKTQTSV